MTDPENIRAVLALRPDYIGLIFYPGSKRFINTLDAEWVAGLNGAKKTGVFVNADINEVKIASRRYGLQAVQLHGSESSAYCAELKDSGVEIIKAFGIHANFNWPGLAEYEAVTDYYLFDTQSIQHGGTGIRFDWTLLSGYVSDKPFFLSGGIGSEHIPDALRLADNRLYALDLNSKFETAPGIKDITLVKQTIQIINDE